MTKKIIAVLLAAVFCLPSPVKAQEAVNPYKFKGTELIAPAALLGLGIIGLENNWWQSVNHDIRDGIQSDGHSKFPIDDYLQFLPILGTYALKLGKVQGMHDMIDVSIIYGTAFLLMAGTLYPMKEFINSDRPNHRNFNSFPSGHTAIAFLGAEVIRREYWKVSPWIGVGAYLFAATTGFLRIYNNAHWLNDVIAGAGLGILCAEAAYWLYPAVTKSLFPSRYKADVYLAPSASAHHIGLNCAITF